VSLSSITRQKVWLDDLVIGLCGGMCFAALDYFNAHNAVPTEALVDAIPAKLRQYSWVATGQPGPWRCPQGP